MYAMRLQSIVNIVTVIRRPNIINPSSYWTRLDCLRVLATFCGLAAEKYQK